MAPDGNVVFFSLRPLFPFYFKSSHKAIKAYFRILQEAIKGLLYVPQGLKGAIGPLKRKVRDQGKASQGAAKPLFFFLKGMYL